MSGMFAKCIYMYVWCMCVYTARGGVSETCSTGEGEVSGKSLGLYFQKGDS